MATTKVTFTLDGDTISRIRATAERLAIAKSQVVREAVREFSQRTGQLREAERLRLLETFDRVVPRIPTRALAEVERELANLRRARRAGGRRARRKRG